jgi:hypothetical protein
MGKAQNMRLIHTSDWHLGRKLKGVDRTPEIALALEEILKYAQEFEVDAVLVAGDIFDVPNPTTESERVAYDFFYKLNQLSIPSVKVGSFVVPLLVEVLLAVFTVARFVPGDLIQDCKKSNVRTTKNVIPPNFLKCIFKFFNRIVIFNPSKIIFKL